MKMKLYNLEEYMVTLQEVRIPAIISPQAPSPWRAPGFRCG